MPKVTKSSTLRRVARRTAVSAPLTTPTKKLTQQKEDGSEMTQGRSRGQRKRQAKRDQYLRREKMILSTLKLKAEEEQKKRIDGLDAIRTALLETTKETPNESTKKDNGDQSLKGKSVKSKKRLLNSEVTHFNLVLQHPAYKSNPFATMQEHLRNTLARQKEEQQAAATQRAQKEETEREQLKRTKKEQLQGIKTKSRKKFKATRSRGR